MARDFDGSGQYLLNSSTPITAQPVTLAAWFNTDATAGSYGILAVGKSTALSLSTDQLSLRLNGTNVQATAGGASSANSASKGTVSTGTWMHGCAVHASTTSRTAYLDGVAGTESTTSITPSGIDRIAIARPPYATATNLFNGRIAECGIWNVALTADEIASLAKGLCPLLVRPQSLVFYAPIWGRNSPEIDLRNGYDMTVTGATQADHCRVVMPARRRQVLVPAAAAASAGMVIRRNRFRANTLLRM